MSSSSDASATFLNRLNLIYYGLLSMSLIVFIYSYLENQEMARVTVINYENDPHMAWILRATIGITCLVDAIAGYRMFRRMIGQVRPEAPLPEKLARYRRAFLIRMMLYIAASLLLAIFYYFSDDGFFAVLYVILFVIIAAWRPTLQDMHKRLSLTDEDLAQLSPSDVVT
ncbi:hypothetical protein SAMN05421823_106268 [Catalinimonas alkaloidigena]|uniref:Uncharacterized protein n=1 Tax=Catalinimonas alkaloidigena TaxID=1075417 RepID=A0A1G9KW11_9BACT|nr:hypothetical protein [Catalinimonas alkaloidigena]SDL53799.1 hypothetical protein SAMN05421823_106268 [Catalinimonas alkaloidigena]